MNAPAPDAHPLDYSTPRKVFKPVNLVTARHVRRGALISVIVGLLIFLAYGLTGWTLFPALGGLWLLVGGAMTTVALIWSFAMMLAIKSEAVNARAGHLIYQWAFLVALLSYPVAFYCLWQGAEWIDTPKFVVRVHNSTGMNLDQVTVHFDRGDVSVGPIAPNSVAASGRVWSGHRGGPLSISVKAGNAVRKKVDRAHCDDDDLHGGQYDLVIEDEALPVAAQSTVPQAGAVQ